MIRYVTFNIIVVILLHKVHKRPMVSVKLEEREGKSTLSCCQFFLNQHHCPYLSKHNLPFCPHFLYFYVIYPGLTRSGTQARKEASNTPASKHPSYTPARWKFLSCPLSVATLFSVASLLDVSGLIDLINYLINDIAMIDVIHPSSIKFSNDVDVDVNVSFFYIFRAVLEELMYVIRLIRTESSITKEPTLQISEKG